MFEKLNREKPYAPLSALHVGGDIMIHFPHNLKVFPKSLAVSPLYNKASALGFSSAPNTMLKETLLILSIVLFIITITTYIYFRFFSKSKRDKSELFNFLDDLDMDVYLADCLTCEIIYANKKMKETYGNDLIGKVCYKAICNQKTPCHCCENFAQYALSRKSDTKQTFKDIKHINNKAISTTGTIIEYGKNKKAFLCLNEVLQVEEFKDLSGSISDPTGKVAAIRELERLSAIQKPFVLILFDIGGVSAFNNVFGKSSGTKLLGEIIAFLSRLKGLQVFMWEDNTLLIISDDLNFEKNTAKIIQERFKKPWQFDDIDYICSYHAGAVSYPKYAKSIKDLLLYTEYALNKAKDGVNTKFCFFNEELEKEVQKYLYIEKRLEEAIKNREIEAHYQPIVNLKTENVEIVEALMRIRDENGAYIPPSEFIPIAVKKGLIVEAGYIMIDLVCRYIKESNCNLRVYINLSAVQLMVESFSSDVKAIVNRYKIDPSKLGFEITESELIPSFDKVVDVISELSLIGIKFAFDDFGAGYTGISYLDKISMHELKIDRSLISSIRSTQKKYQLVKLLINIAHQFNMAVVAEGVEDIETVKLLSEIGCDYIQGYYYDKPLTEGEFKIKYLK